MISAILPLAISWLCAPVFLLFDGRRAPVCWSATAAIASVAVADIAFLADIILHDRGALTMVAGDWPAGVGIRLHIDGVSLFFGAVCSAVMTAAMAHEAMSEVRSAGFPALLLFMCAGLHGAFFTGDLFNFYVFFEISVVSSFALAAYGFGREEFRGAFIYIVVNLLGSVLFLTGIAVVYHITGTLDLVDLWRRGSDVGRGVPYLGAALLFAALSLKLGLFPLHFWVPVLYSHARPAVAAVMSGALINIGAYGLLRIGMLSAETARADGAILLVVLGSVAILYGALLAARRETPAEVIAYASIAQAGYIVLALGAGGPLGAAAALLAVLGGSIEKATMFLAGAGTGAVRATTALIAAGGVAGLPLTVGFVAKVELFQAAVLAPAAPIAPVALVLGSALLVVAAVRFWTLLRRAPRPERPNPGIPVVLAGATVVLALAAAPLNLMVHDLGMMLTSGGGR